MIFFCILLVFGDLTHEQVLRRFCDGIKPIFFYSDALHALSLVQEREAQHAAHFASTTASCKEASG